MTEQWQKDMEDIIKEVGGGPLSEEAQAALHEANRLANGGKPEPTVSQPAPAPASGPRSPVMQAVLVPLNLLRDGPFQVRKEIDGDALQEMADNMAHNGLDTPITVRPKDGQFEIVCGHRRVQAFRRLQFNAKTEQERQLYSSIPAFVVEGMTDAEMAEKGWIENVLRANLTPLETALGLLQIQRLRTLPTAVEVSARTGLKLPRTQRLLRIAQSPLPIREGMSEGILVPIPEEVSAEDDRPENEKPREERRTLDFFAALAFCRLHAGLLAKGGDGTQKAADEQTAKYIHQALTANWSLKTVEKFVDGQLGMTPPRPHRKQPGKAKGNRRVAFTKAKGKLVIYPQRLSNISAEKKKELREALEPIWNWVNSAD